MILKSLGEFGLIEAIEKWVTHAPSGVVVGIGDDAAVLEGGGDRRFLMTADAFVEGVHFDLRYATPWQIGWKCMVANLSDIAAMGGEPGPATVSICLPGSLRAAHVEGLYRGMDAAARPFGSSIVGGDTTSIPDRIVIAISMIGSVRKDRAVLRRGARVGDLICVTGDLGSSQAGLDLVRKAVASGTSDLLRRFPRTVKRHLEPTPRIWASRALSEAVRLHAMIDISDGLSSEINHLCARSRVGARIFLDRIPIAPETREAAEVLFLKPVLDYALSGGEEFELLFTLSSSDRSAAESAVRKSEGVETTVIGEIVEAQEGVRAVGAGGAQWKLRSEGYSHF